MEYEATTTSLVNLAIVVGQCLSYVAKGRRGNKNGTNQSIHQKIMIEGFSCGGANASALRCHAVPTTVLAMAMTLLWLGSLETLRRPFMDETLTSALF